MSKINYAEQVSNLLSTELKNEYSEEQRSIISAPLGCSMLVLACPGSGKTFTLIERAIYLLKKGASSDSMALLTFTKETAEQFSTKIAKKNIKKPPLCSTIHALAYSILKKNKKINILTDVQCFELFTKALTLVEPRDENNENEKDFYVRFQCYRESLTNNDEYLNELIAEYKKLMRELDSFDFTAILEELLVKKSVPSFKFLFIDEVQDLSPLQFNVLRKIAAFDCKIAYFGDIDQSIYSFKGSSFSVFQQILDSTNVAIKYLTVNFRSKSKIVEASQCLIAGNKSDLRKKSVSSDLAEDGKVRVDYCESDKEELSYILSFIEENRFNNKSSCVLFRTNAHLDKILDADYTLRPFLKTIHESKGLEWDAVLICGCEESNIPHLMGNLEEERRLFYVAVTRARQQVIAHFVKTRKNLKNESTKSPSRFLYELQLPNFS